MKGLLNKATLTLAFSSLASSLLAQSESAGGSDILIYTLIAVAILMFFYIVINVADNLLVIEAKQSGIDVEKNNLTLFPRLGELFGAKKAAYTAGYPVHLLRKGHDILLEGEAQGDIIPAQGITRYAVQPTNFLGLQPIPKMVVNVGDAVKAGDPVFFDKKMPEVQFVAPVSGEIIEINRGAKRAITEVVILADKDQQLRQFDVPELGTASAEDLRNFLQQTGAWTLLRQRPYNVVPGPNDVARDIFVSTFDTAPLAPDNNKIVAGQEAAFQQGLDVLTHLTSGKVYLGLDARGTEAPAAAFREAQHVEINYFSGKHPAGNVGVQIHHVAPVGGQDKVWTLGVQEVITLGHLFLNGQLNMSRVVALGGSELQTPAYVQTFAGANLDELLQGNMKGEKSRIISGDVLSGEGKGANQYLNWYDDQVSVIEEGDYFELFGWLLPIAARPSISNTFPNFLFPNQKFKANTNTHGEKRAFVVTNDYEQVMPMDVYPQALMKAIIVNDFERMEGLGLLELVEEDIALCEFVCVSKQPLQQILREGLETMREQG